MMVAMTITIDAVELARTHLVMMNRYRYKLGLSKDGIYFLKFRKLKKDSV